MVTDMTTTGIANSANCQWCGMIHGAKCPLVKAIEYEGGMVKRVEFFAPNDYGPKLGAGPYVTDFTNDPRFTAAAPAYFGGWHGHILATSRATC